VTQIIEGIQENPALKKTLKSPVYKARWDKLELEHAARLANFASLAKPLANDTFDENFIAAIIKQSVPNNTVFVLDAVTLPVNIANQLQVDLPGHWINCGGTGLGWSGGAALGVKLAHSENRTEKFLCQIVGDGAYMFSIPSGV
jgi:thiamine pyrophosphate-dependent acetolactate synthase large subunit-like protein